MILTRRTSLWVTAALAMGVVVAGGSSPASATARDDHQNDRGFVQTNLVSNIPGMAVHTDPDLRNPWGISTAPRRPLWVSDNGTGLSTLYDGAGNPAPSPTPLVVTIPAPTSAGAGATGTPTGTVFNTEGKGFAVTKAGRSGLSQFLFATEDGTLVGWNPTVDHTTGVIAVDRSTATDPEGDVGAIYKGLALASTKTGQFLYATNFRFGQVEIFDSSFSLVRTFTDPRLPSGYAPFGIQNINGRLFVTFAKQDADKADDAAGPGHGFVDVFNTSGVLLQRFAASGRLDSPWAVTLAPSTVKGIGGDILVGNFGDGRINAYSPHGRFLQVLRNTEGKPIAIPGLWDLKFPTGSLNVTANALYFTAGINGEADGLLGKLTARR
jgi:uncharacterized protein (TIGR03118 family)